QQAAEGILKDKFTLADLGLKLRTLNDQQAISLESDSAVISDVLAEKSLAATQNVWLKNPPYGCLPPIHFLTYLANTIQVGDKEIPYSLVTATNHPNMANLSPSGVALNDWAALDLGAKLGDEVTFEYFAWKEEGRLDTQQAKFKVERIVPMQGLAADRNLAPEYPGI